MGTPRGNCWPRERISRRGSLGVPDESALARARHSPHEPRQSLQSPPARDVLACYVCACSSLCVLCRVSWVCVFVCARCGVAYVCVCVRAWCVRAVRACICAPCTCMCACTYARMHMHSCRLRSARIFDLRILTHMRMRNPAMVSTAQRSPRALTSCFARSPSVGIKIHALAMNEDESPRDGRRRTS